jgi:hypothetical protein
MVAALSVPAPPIAPLLACLRSAPRFQLSAKRRLVFAQSEDLPPFWRVDLDVLVQSIQKDYQYDVR